MYVNMYVEVCMFWLVCWQIDLSRAARPKKALFTTFFFVCVNMGVMYICVNLESNLSRHVCCDLESSQAERRNCLFSRPAGGGLRPFVGT